MWACSSSGARVQLPEVFVTVGSNLEPEKNLRLCVSELRTRFNLKRVSPVYRSKALGFDGDKFLNAVAVVETGLSPAEVCRELEKIHDVARRRRGADAFVSRTLDIDLLLYGQEIVEALRVPRPDVLEYSFVLGPLADVAPDLRHPVTGETIAWHWEEYDRSAHPLEDTGLILLNGYP